MTVRDASRALRIALADVRTPMVPSSTREPTASSRTGSRYLRLSADSTFYLIRLYIVPQRRKDESYPAWNFLSMDFPVTYVQRMIIVRRLFSEISAHEDTAILFWLPSCTSNKTRQAYKNSEPFSLGTRKLHGESSLCFKCLRTGTFE